MAVPDAGCGGGESVVLILVWLWSGEALVLMADPDTDCWGWKGLTLMAIPDTGYGGDRRVLSWQSQMLVVRSVEE